MSAADWLVSDEVTEALARIKREMEREAEEAGTCECCSVELHDQEAYSCYGRILCEDCWSDATGGKA